MNTVQNTTLINIEEPDFILVDTLFQDEILVALFLLSIVLFWLSWRWFYFHKYQSIRKAYKIKSAFQQNKITQREAAYQLAAILNKTIKSVNNQVARQQHKIDEKFKNCQPILNNLRYKPNASVDNSTMQHLISDVIWLLRHIRC